MTRVLFAAAASTLVLVQSASAAPLARECAARDLQTITAIEESGTAQTVPSERLSQAFFMVMDARAQCGGGQVADAVQTYDRAIATFQSASAR